MSKTADNILEQLAGSMGLGVHRDVALITLPCGHDAPAPTPRKAMVSSPVACTHCEKHYRVLHQNGEVKEIREDADKALQARRKNGRK